MKKLWAVLQSRTLEIFAAVGWTGITIYFALEFFETRKLVQTGAVWARENMVAQGLLVLVHLLIAAMLWKRISRKNQQKHQADEEK